MIASVQFQVFSLLQCENKLSIKVRSTLSCVSKTCNQVVDKEKIQTDVCKLNGLRNKFMRNLRRHPMMRLYLLDKFAQKNPDFSRVNTGSILLTTNFPSFIHFYKLTGYERSELNVSPERSFPHPMDKFEFQDYVLWQSFYRLCIEYGRGNYDVNPNTVYDEFNNMPQDYLESLGW
jgi:hypothetical protein